MKFYSPPVTWGNKLGNLSKHFTNGLFDRYKTIAYCTSSKCISEVYGLKNICSNIKYIEKDVPKHETFCPDCGSALYRKKIRMC